MSVLEPKFYTKTFIEHRWMRRDASASITKWYPVPSEDDEHGKPLDQQVREWVDASGANICDPGTPGIHKQWYKEGTLLCISVALSVLYSEGGQQHAEPVAE
jgi:hypothetical protein